MPDRPEGGRVAAVQTQETPLPRHQESGVSAGHPLVRSARCSVLTASLPLGGKAPWASVPGCRALLRRATLDAGSMLGRWEDGVKGPGGFLQSGQNSCLPLI